MKLQSLRMAVLAAAFVASPLLVFAGGQPAKVRMPKKTEMQDRSGITQAVQQGKGAGTTRKQAVLGSEAYLAHLTEDSPSGADKSGGAMPNWGDSAFRK